MRVSELSFVALAALSITGCESLIGSADRPSDPLNPMAADVSYPSAILADKPIAYYRFEEVDGTTASDSSGNHYNGVYTGSYRLGRTGAPGTDAGVAVDLTGGAMVLPATVGPWSGSFTIEAWVKPLTRPTWRDLIFAKEKYRTNGFRIGYDEKLRPMLWADESGGRGSAMSRTSMTLNQWHHVAVTVTSSKVRVFLDGVERGSAGVKIMVPQSGGSFGQSSGRAANLHLDEAACYSGALAAQRIVEHYQAAKQPKSTDSGVPHSDAGLSPEQPDGSTSPGQADSSLTPPPADGAQGSTCSLTNSGPIAASHSGQVIENLRITATNGPAVRVNGYSNVKIRNVAIKHNGGQGIELSGADDVLIEYVSIENSGTPTSGANDSSGENNISCYNSARPTIRHVRLTRGSSGIYLLLCPDSLLSFIEGHDFRGPFPRGQLVQWDKSNNSVLEDFSVINTAASWPEDNVNIYQSTNVTVRRGLVDGNNSPSGVGVIFDGETAKGLVEDVDAIRMGNGCFSAYAGADGSIFRRTRCRENICGDQGRGLPLSNALMWAGRPGLSQLRIEQSLYWASCNGNLVWPDETFAVIDLKPVDFQLRAPIVHKFCWE